MNASIFPCEPKLFFTCEKYYLGALSDYKDIYMYEIEHQTA